MNIDTLKSKFDGGSDLTWEDQQDLLAEVERLLAEMSRMRMVVRDCARTLQHNLSAYYLKDEPMMLRSLENAWAAVGRSFCESDLPNAQANGR